MLLILIIFVISLRYLVPGKSIPVEYIRLVHDQNLTDSVNTKAYPDSDLHVSRKIVAREHRVKVVDLNRCDTAELIRLPGIGPVLSVRIIKYRNLLGGFYTVEQLKEVYGLPVETYDLIKDQIFVDSLVISTINVNVADFKTLIRFPYFDRNEVSSILKYRDYKDGIGDLNELVDNKLITKEKALKLKSYLSFE